MATLFGGAVSPKKALPFQLKPYDRRTQKSGKPLIKNSISSDAFDCNEENQGRDTNDSLHPKLITENGNIRQQENI